MGTKTETKSERVYKQTFDDVNIIVADLKPRHKVTKPDVYAKAVQRELYWLKQWEEMNPVQVAKILCENLLNGNVDQEQVLKDLLRLLIEMEAIESSLQK